MSFFFFASYLSPLFLSLPVVSIKMRTLKCCCYCCCIILGLLIPARHAAVEAQNANYNDLLEGPFTLRKRMPSRRKRNNALSILAAEEMGLCDRLIGCAGVTFSVDLQQAAARRSRGRKHSLDLEVMVHNFVPSEVSITNKDRIVSRLEEIERRNVDLSAERNDDSAARPIIFTYQSRKDYIFHRGFIPADARDRHRYSIPSVGLVEAKKLCTADPHCIAFTFPIVPSPAHVNISAAENVTFVSRVSTIEREAGDAADKWRSYISNDADATSGKVNAEEITIKKKELLRPFATQRCCTRKGPLPSLEVIRRADKLQRVSCDVSKAEFRALYETPRLPVVLEGCDSDWPASRKWKRDILARRFENETTFVGKFHYRRVDPDNFETWGWIQQAMATGQEYYVFDSLIADPEVSKLKHDFELPAPIENIYLQFDDFPPGYGPSRWFTYGSNGSGTWPHLDPIGADAWNYVAQGLKWWILYPRGEEEEYSNLLCTQECSLRLWNSDHWFATVGVSAGLNEYDGTDPLKRPVHVLQKPGEVLYVPNGVVHAVLNLDDTVAVAAHFASTQNLEKVWETIVSLGSDKHWMKAYFGGILDKVQRKLVRRISPFWPPIPGDMYFYDGPFLPPQKRIRQRDMEEEDDDDDFLYDDDEYSSDDDDDDDDY